MLQQTLTSLRKPGSASTRAVVVPDLAVRLAGALFALEVSTVHVADQGGISAFASPAWIGVLCVSMLLAQRRHSRAAQS